MDVGVIYAFGGVRGMVGIVVVVSAVGSYHTIIKFFDKKIMYYLLPNRKQTKTPLSQSTASLPHLKHFDLLAHAQSCLLQPL